MLACTLPWLEFVRNSSIPLIVLTVSSTGFARVDSTSSALAPGSCTLTLAFGWSVFGIKSTPRVRYEKTPSVISAMDIMIAKTGRLILTSATFIDCLPSLPLRRRRVFRPFLLLYRLCRLRGRLSAIRRPLGLRPLARLLHRRHRFWCRIQAHSNYLLREFRRL